MDLNGWLANTRLVVCVGSGGVGKTTTAASIALWGAVHGRKAMVLTIDPAKRLANSLGLSRFEHASSAMTKFVATIDELLGTIIDRL